MVYRPDGTGRDMYVLGPRSTKGPQIVDVAARTTNSMNKDANRQLLNASLSRTDNKVPSNIPEFELKVLVCRKISERAQSSAMDRAQTAAKLTMMASVDEMNGSTSHYSTSHGNGANPPTPIRRNGAATRGIAPLSASTIGNSSNSTLCIGMGPSVITATRYNSGLASGGNGPAMAGVLSTVHKGEANACFTTSQRCPSTYVSPKTPSTPANACGRVGINTLSGTSPMANYNTARTPSTARPQFGGTNTWYPNASLAGSMRAGLNGSTAAAAAGASTYGANASTPTSPNRRDAPSAGFDFNRHIYESTKERALRTGLSFQLYEAPVNRAVFPEIRARYTNL